MGVFHSVDDLVAAIKEYLEVRNDDPNRLWGPPPLSRSVSPAGGAWHRSFRTRNDPLLCVSPQQAARLEWFQPGGARHSPHHNKHATAQAPHAH